MGTLKPFLPCSQPYFLVPLVHNPEKIHIPQILTLSIHNSHSPVFTQSEVSQSKVQKIYKQT